MFFYEMKKSITKLTENGAVGYDSTGEYLLDLNFRIPFFREKIDTDLFDLALNEDSNYTLRWLLYLRDIKFGVGERNSFRKFLIHLCNKYEELGYKFVSKVNINEYGRWDDIIYLYFNIKSDKIKSKIIKILYNRLSEDIRLRMDNKPISLLAKWMPSVNASKKARSKALCLCKQFGFSEKLYRRTLSNLRNYLNIVESDMSNNDWENINYSAVPSKANLLYRNAFLRHDFKRRTEYLSSDAKINANSMFLYDIVHNYFRYDETREKLWKAQDSVVGFSDTLVVRDGSASMLDHISSSSVTALDVANALTLYCSENNIGEYKDKFITFSSEPRLVDLVTCSSLFDKLNKLSKHYDCTNTNIKAVFDLILRTAISKKLKQDDLPKRILIITDCEFDGYTFNLDKSLFDEIKLNFSEHGLKVPKLVFWNVNSRTNVVPTNTNELGLTLISGFNKNSISMILSDRLNPLDALLDILDNDRYNIIDEVLK